MERRDFLKALLLFPVLAGCERGSTLADKKDERYITGKVVREFGNATNETQLLAWYANQPNKAPKYGFELKTPDNITYTIGVCVPEKDSMNGIHGLDTLIIGIEQGTVVKINTYEKDKGLCFNVPYNSVVVISK